MGATKIRHAYLSVRGVAKHCRKEERHVPKLRDYPADTPTATIVDDAKRELAALGFRSVSRATVEIVPAEVEVNDGVKILRALLRDPDHVSVPLA